MAGWYAVARCSLEPSSPRQWRSRKKVRSVDSKISGSPKAHFSLVQMNPILNDYVEVVIMLDYNDRDVAAAWY